MAGFKTNNPWPSASYTNRGTVHAQGYDPVQFMECVRTEIKMDYTPIIEREWSKVYGAPPPSIDKYDYNPNIRFTTNMIGVATRLKNDRDYEMTTASWSSAHMTIGGYCKWGVMAEYYPDEEFDYRYETSAEKISGLNRIMEAAQENDMARYLFSNPVGGWEGDKNRTMFSNNHSIIANRSLCISNFIQGGTPSQTTIAEIDRYGDNFLTHEGFRSKKKVVLIVTGSENARRWEYEYAREDNLSPNKPEILGVDNIPNSNMSFIFFEGYAQALFMQIDYQNKIETYEHGPPKRICVYHTGKWRMFFTDPRLFAVTGGFA